MNKLQNMVDTAANLSPAATKRLNVLIDIQRKHDKIEKEFFKERGALELKYQKLYEPLYAKRYDIVNGVVEVDELKDDTTNTKEDKGMPAFWLTAMKTNDILAEEISERDEDALKYLKDIKWCRIDDPKGFKLKFIFDTNPYFTNSVLTKVYHMNAIDDNEHILEKAIGIDIKWLPRKCLTQKIIKKIPKKGSRYVKSITKTEKCESFFNFFNPPRVPENEDDIDEEEAVELLNQMEQDYVIGATIRDQIIPHAVSWFTGKAAMPDMLVNHNDDDKDDTDEEDEEKGKSKAKTEESKSKGKTEENKSKGKTEEEGDNSNAGKTGKQIELPPECTQQ